MFCHWVKGNDVLNKTLSGANHGTVFDDLTFDNVAKIADLLTEKFVLVTMIN
jgi:F-type H+-transporting ATPase subunit gamma